MRHKVSTAKSCLGSCFLLGMLPVPTDPLISLDRTMCWLERVEATVMIHGQRKDWSDAALGRLPAVLWRWKESVWWRLYENLQVCFRVVRAGLQSRMDQARQFRWRLRRKSCCWGDSRVQETISSAGKLAWTIPWSGVVLSCFYLNASSLTYPLWQNAYPSLAQMIWSRHEDDIIFWFRPKSGNRRSVGVS